MRAAALLLVLLLLPVVVASATSVVGEWRLSYSATIVYPNGTGRVLVGVCNITAYETSTINATAVRISVNATCRGRGASEAAAIASRVLSGLAVKGSCWSLGSQATPLYCSQPSLELQESRGPLLVRAKLVYGNTTHLLEEGSGVVVYRSGVVVAARFSVAAEKLLGVEWPKPPTPLLLLAEWWPVVAAVVSLAATLILLLWRLGGGA